VNSQIKQRFPKLKSTLFAFSGILYAWLVLGNVIGYGLAYPYIEEVQQYNSEHEEMLRECYPHLIWGGYETNCESQIAQIAYFIAVGIPGAIMTIFGTCFGLLYKNWLDFEDDWFFEGLYWLLWVLPIVLLVIIPGSFYWKNKSKIIFIILNIIFIIFAFFLMRI
jgi:hypothetical protein